MLYGTFGITGGPRFGAVFLIWNVWISHRDCFIGDEMRDLVGKEFIASLTPIYQLMSKSSSTLDDVPRPAL